jgi:hypothetical protein
MPKRRAMAPLLGKQCLIKLTNAGAKLLSLFYFHEFERLPLYRQKINSGCCLSVMVICAIPLQIVAAGCRNTIAKLIDPETRLIVYLKLKKTRLTD